VRASASSIARDYSVSQPIKLSQSSNPTAPKSQVLLGVTPLLKTHEAGLRAHLLHLQNEPQLRQSERLQELAAALQRVVDPAPPAAAATAAAAIEPASAREQVSKRIGKQVRRIQPATTHLMADLLLTPSRTQVLDDPHLLGHCISFLGLPPSPPSITGCRGAAGGDLSMQKVKLAKTLLSKASLVSRRWLAVSRRDAFWRPLVAASLPVAAATAEHLPGHEEEEKEEEGRRGPVLIRTRGNWDGACFRCARRSLAIPDTYMSRDFEIERQSIY
jgi:hypothetical protein